ncbi:MAG: slipin family protein [Oscillospiraceae bacterium]
MKKIVINENQRGFLFKSGKFVKLLEAGKYYVYGDRDIEIVSVFEPVHSLYCGLNVLMECPEIKNSVTYIEVPARKLALHFINGKFSKAIECGVHAYWNTAARHEFQMVDISNPEVPESIPACIFYDLSTLLYKRIEVSEYKKARLFIDGKFERILDPGVYYFWTSEHDVSVSYVDTRLKQLDITGQEIMTADKVSVRVNYVCYYRVTDYIKSYTEVDDFEELIHVAAQLALRDYTGKHKLDEILANKEEMSRYVLERLKEKEECFYAEIFDGGVKDIILPGEIRDIMNTVIAAEKRAQANVITRREEVASTRSLLNTAKLMDENQTLYRLKELEYIERICENAGSINLNGGGDILAQLTSLIHKAG